MRTRHPSFYRLDRVVLGESPSADVGTHVATCDRCRTYIDSGGAVLPAPAWLEAHATVPPRLTFWVKVSRRLRSRWVWVAAPVLGAAMVLLVVRPLERSESAAVRAKGSPTVIVYVKRGDGVAAWDGRTAVVADDRLRLRIMAADYSFLSVASLADSSRSPVELYAGAAADSHDGFLPVAFRVDSNGPREILSVVLARHSIPLALHAELSRGRGAEDDVWSTRIVLPKERVDAAP